MKIHNLLPYLFLFTALQSHAATYYVDASLGNDNSAGTSPAQPWQSLTKVDSFHFLPGDKILFHDGDTWNGQLKPPTSGAEGHPIVFSSYGTGDMPILNGQGAFQSTVKLYNVDYVTVMNLEITNTGLTPKPHRTGLEIDLSNFGTAKGFLIDHLYIHDVNGSEIKSAGGGAGISFNCGGTTTKTRFDGLTIENCHLVRCDRNGIVGSGNWQRNNWFPSLHVVIKNNLLEHDGGDGIVPIACDGCMIEHNILRDDGWNLPMGEYAAGIWPWSCDNTTVEFNEVSGQHGGGDAQGFDSDWNCSNTLIQYNYSHNNEGGFLLVCNDGSSGPEYSVGNVGTVVRYNLSVDDGYRITGQEHDSPTFHFAGPTNNTSIYNNTVVIGAKPAGTYSNSVLVMSSWHGFCSNSTFKNNIFYSTIPVSYDLGQATGTSFVNNDYFGPQTNLPTDNSAMHIDPDFLGPVYPAEGPKFWLGFLLKKQSDLFGKGIPVNHNGGRDLVGVKLPKGAVTIGALQK